MAWRSPGDAAVNRSPLKITILGLSITSSWGNGHATTYRSLVRALAGRGNDVLFLERDAPWYAENRDLPKPLFGRTKLYKNIEELKENYTSEARNSDLIIVGSYVPEGVEVGNWAIASAGGAVAFYDIDTPVTLSKLEQGKAEYINKELIGRYDLYLSFAGGLIPDLIEKKYGSPMARVLYCSVDPECYYPEPGTAKNWDLGYLGTYSYDRQPALESFMLEPARRWPNGRMIVAGALYPARLDWPKNVHHISHLAPADHRRFYNSQRFALNVTRADMIQAGYSPSVRLFEAAACATPIISDWWDGLDSLFEIGSEILIARRPEDTLHYLRDMEERERSEIGERSRSRVLQKHTSDHRASELESYIRELGVGPR
jgi:spore maturation protein CgeB